LSHALKRQDEWDQQEAAKYPHGHAEAIVEPSYAIDLAAANRDKVDHLDATLYRLATVSPLVRGH
jgi:hypothetical protein